MSVGNVRQITVSNNGAYNANIRLVSGNGNTYPLSPKVEAGDKNIVFDLTKVQGPNNGDTFQVRVVSDVGAQSTDQTVFTYTKNASNQAIYSVSGTSNAPVISFQNLSPL
ncbi:hypothetical protein C8J56DRAFT_1031220 [Mycena floridula]|nr:hypothetical protein C8J56DRAFT_1031219 [Mycena floridula]KAJ7577890.1 hypothetical protein C8J56DRAFT_1031220 [Mycena floridula]